jgi:hypothetical protein
MNTSIDFKKQFSPIFSMLFAIGLLAGCASVTDANIEQPEEAPAKITSVDNALDNANLVSDDFIWDSSIGDDMDPIIPRPPSGGTYHE